MPSEVELDTIAREIKSWLDFQQYCEGGYLDDEHYVMSFPVYPTRGVLKNWVKCLAGEELLEEPNIYYRG